MLYKAKFADWYEIRIKHIKQCEHHVEFLNIKSGRT
jgi:hypothetical protein